MSSPRKPEKEATPKKLTAGAEAGRPRGRKRPRVTPFWRRGAVLASTAVLAVGLVGGGLWWMTRSGVVEAALNDLGQRAVALSAEAGLAVRDVRVLGRDQTPRGDLLAAVGLGRGSPILDFDPESARRRIEALPWVRAASVERLLPDTIFLRLEERRPLAIWQKDGRHVLIDHGGDIVPAPRTARHDDLLVVVGSDANRHAADLLDTLKRQPLLRRHVVAAVRVGGRRWNLRLDNGIDVRLPEKAPESALKRLADWQRTHHILARDVAVLDLRLPDRLIVRGTDVLPPAALTGPGAGRST